MYDNAEALFGGPSQLLSLIELIYEAADDMSLWPLVLDRIAEAVHGEATVLFANYTGLASNIATHTRIDPAALASYAEYYGTRNVLISRGDEVFKDGEPRFSHQALSNRELEKTEYYDGYLLQHKIYYGLGIKVVLDGHAPALLSTLRSKSKGPFEEREGQIFATLLPHLQRAMKLHLKLSHLRSKTEGLEAALSAFDVSVFGLNRRGEVIFSNEPARRAVKANDGIALRSGGLATNDETQRDELRRLIERTVLNTMGPGYGGGGSMLLRRQSGQPPLRLTVMPFTPSSALNLGEVRALVFLSDGAARPLSRSAALRALYGLSPTECRLADLLASGREVAAAAEEIGITFETARFHLKSIFSKTKVNKQGKLIRLVLSLPGQA